ncbi:MAG: hypothetical protein Q8868_03235 [Bacteroidota bacterium]|nr:hypothetical protein [Bacteroidota bacterium]
MKKAIFLHHSTGQNIWLGGVNKLVNKITGKNSVQEYFNSYNKTNGKDYSIKELFFPKASPYGWKNYPFDYYNIWVKNSGLAMYMEEPTLEILTGEYDIIIFKHCYPVSKIQPNTGNSDINSEDKSLDNYKLQYNALKDKMHSLPDNKFIIWTPAVHIKALISEDEAKRTAEFHDWMIGEWKERNDNIYIWDFYKLETEGELYLKDEYSEGPGNSHPNAVFSSRVSPLFSQFIIDVIESKSVN